jgi:hypothetical protein
MDRSSQTSSSRRNCIKRAITFLVALGCVVVTTGVASQQPRLYRDGNQLLWRSPGRKPKLVKALAPGQRFQGFSVVDSGRLFLAYSDAGGEATTWVSIFSLSGWREERIVQIGATGESEFDYEASTGIMVFNWYDGLYVFSLKKSVQLPDRGRLKAFEKTLVKILSCSSGRCFEPRWEGNDRVKCRDETGDTPVERHIQIPRSALDSLRDNR